ncbi:MAG TPA: sigma-70 family RNA polymerase sigma factor [Kofleriaceae bacterium]|jgi:RNA polymerase sigma-70 factor (ECF subfamily)|nr:sigma-70 family RNA polymerase sigma factor [Kofleriaceae bacterium]
MARVDRTAPPPRDADAPEGQEGPEDPGQPEHDGADPDGDIVALIERGAFDAALTSLMRRHGVAVYRYCREELHDRTLADDVHQQIFIQAHRDLGRFAARSTLRTWLFAIARHRVLDAAKSRRRAQAHIEEDDTADTPDPSPPPGDRLDEARLHQALIACLRELGEHVRGTLVLRYQQGFTFEELGALLREKPGTLQARVMRALPILRACIEERTGSKV